MLQENKFRNEMVIKLGAVEILLRPTFENIANVESKLGGIHYLAFKYGQGANESKVVDQVKHSPTMTDISLIIYFCQADDAEGNKPYTLAEISDMVQGYLFQASALVVKFLSLMTAGNKMAPELTDKTKKK